MLVRIGLVSELEGQKDVPISELMRVSAALQTQVLRDVTPAWGAMATVDAFNSLEDVPVSYWPIIIVNDVKNAAGIHQDADGRPFGLVEFGNRWTLTASHETLEMLVDPFGNRLEVGPSVKKDQGPVEYLVEVCDPSEDIEFAYEIDGVVVSDFYTKHFFDPFKSSGVKYSFVGAITSPRQVLPGGYLSWRDPATNHWWQQRFFDAEPTLSDLGPMSASAPNFRFFVDRFAIADKRKSPCGSTPADHKNLVQAGAVKKVLYSSQKAKASRVREQIVKLKAEHG